MSTSQSTTSFEPTGFGGRLIHPRDPEYDDTRAVFNAMIDRKPAVIARCRNAADVAAVIGLAREHGLPLSIYGGGHGVTGAAVVDDGIVLDLRDINAVDVDVAGKVARVGGGATWGDVDAATQEHGLAVTGGRVSTTGVGGLTLGSGSGWLERKLGYVCDNLLQAEVVTADGRIVTASPAENDDLFWALRGGGGNFGIVTTFHLQLHELGPTVLGGLLVYPPDNASELVRFYREFLRTAPDAVGGGLAFICAPPEEFVPEPVRGQPVIGVVVCYAGPVDEGEAAFKPLRDFGPPAVDMVAPMPYAAVQQLLDPANPHGMRNYWSGDFLADLPDEAVDVLVGIATKPVSPMTQIILVPGGGAVARVDDEATAFGQRNAPWNMHYLSMWADAADDDKNIAYTRHLAASMKPWTTGEVYLNFIGDEGLTRVESAFGPAKWKRLTELKKKWDPDNVFRHNQNIPPAP
jgi:FAD/FMN-containing dehydrogenase